MEENAPTITFQAVIENQVYIAQNTDFALIDQTRFRRFSTKKVLKYHSLCDDFGPMNMGSVIRFIQTLQAEIATFPQKKIVYCVEEGRRAMTNAVFLLGAYMIIKMKLKSEQVSKSFRWLDHSVIEPFRDATFEKPDFELTLNDCWRGLERGMNLGWVRLPSADGLWGKIEVEEYEHYDDPLNADLHEVVPGKFIAFKGPKDLSGKEFHDDERGYRTFSPDYYVDIFEMLGVRAVIRLNEPEYDAFTSFEAHGIRHYDLEFEDCSSPPTRIVDEFFKAVGSTRGAVAVHCKAGLGRTGTLIALYLMRNQGFGAREAMGWLRIMRPGCVIGEQQHYLCAVEAELNGAELAKQQPRDRQLLSSGSNVPKAKSSLIAAQVAAGMERQAAARIRSAIESSRRHSQA